jgi:hypothetical protein
MGTPFISYAQSKSMLVDPDGRRFSRDDVLLLLTIGIGLR